MTTFKRFPTLFLCAALAVSAWADRVSQEDAATVANNFMNAGASLSGAKKAPAKRMVLKKAAQAEESQFYIYENADGEGWVMVAANDIARPILAYSDEGQFRFDNQPDNIKSWLGGYNKQIKNAEINQLEASEEIKAEWQTLRKGERRAKQAVVVSPMLTTLWDQDNPYWKYCPKKSGENTLTGCVATAMAQVMNYWEWPVTGSGTASTTCDGTTYTVNFANTTYDWNNMNNRYAMYYNEGDQYYTSTSLGTTAQQDAVATLMYHCGVAVQMSYGTNDEGGSGAQTVRFNSNNESYRCAQNALWKNFGYNKSKIKGYYRNGGSGYSSWTRANWIAMLKEELDAARPIMYAGGDSQNQYGHSFVCDGYDSSNKFHFNWGWSGYCNGYYDVDALDPGPGGSGSGDAGDYSYYQDVIIGIEPPEVGHTIKLNGTGCTLSSDKQRVENGNSVTITITPTDATYDYTSTTVTLGGATISSSYYTLNSGKTTLTINGSAITGESSNDLTITVVWTKNRYKYELLGENCTEELEGMVNKNAPLNLTITPASGYTLADAACWEVTMGGNTLTYGTGFTYSGTTFSISSVTGDVEIYAYGGHTVTWSVQGITSTTTFADGASLVLPSNPSDCSGEGGKKFVGWTANSTVSGSAPADLFNSAGSKTVTANTTYYAVYATAGTSGGGSSEVASVTFSNASSDGTADKSSSISDLVSSASGISSYSGSKVYVGTTGIKLGSGSATGSVTITLASAANVKTVKVTAKKYGSDTGTLSVKAGDTSIGTAQTPPASAGELTFTTESAVANAATITVATSSKRAYISSITVIADGGGTSYSNYSLICGVPCSNTPSMSFSPETEGKTTADVSFTKAVSVSGTGSSQTVTYSSSDESVATVNNSGVVTLKGKVGSTTITASVEASGTYCAASASYTLNVTAAPIDVTLYYNGTSTTLTNQANPYTLPTGSPYNTAMCSGDWTFVGWYSSAYSKSTTAPTYITQLTATSSAYAVYTTTETSWSGGSSEVASVTFANASSDGSADKSSSISDLVASASGISSYSGSKVYAGTTGIKLGSGSATGSVTLTLSAAADVKTVKVTAKKYGSDTGTLSVKAGSTSIGDALAPPTSAGELTFTAESAIEDATTITVATSTKRAYISSITVITGSGSTSTTYYATSPDCAGPPVPTYTVTYMSCGVEFTTQTYAEGAALVLPDPAPEDNAGKSFCGWTTSEHYTGADAPTLISAGSAVNANATYYAVFH